MYTTFGSALETEIAYRRERLLAAGSIHAGHSVGRHWPRRSRVASRRSRD